VPSPVAWFKSQEPLAEAAAPEDSELLSKSPQNIRSRPSRPSQFLLVLPASPLVMVLIDALISFNVEKDPMLKVPKTNGSQTSHPQNGKFHPVVV